ITGGGTGGTVSGLPTGVTGRFAGTTFTVTGPPTVSGTFNYTVNTTGTCAQTSATGSITVNPNQAIALTSAAGTNTQTLCAFNPITNITYSISGGGTGGGITGLPAGVNGTFSAGVFTISGTPSASGPFNYTITTSGTCAPTSASGSITVNPKPALTITDPSAVCSPLTVDITAASVTAGSFMAGGTLSYWTNAAATSALASPNAVSSTGTYYIKAGTGAGCMDIKAVNVVVNPTPSLQITNPIAVCAPFTVDITPAFITTGSNLAGGSLSYWTDAGATIVLATPSVIATTGTYYIKASTAAGCMDIKPVAVTVNTNCNNIGLAMQAAAPVPTGNGSYTITYTINVGNYSVVPITNIAVTEDLNSIFPAPATFSVVSVSATGSLIANNALSGVNTGVVNLLASGSTLPLSGSEQITFVINVFPNTSPGPYYNSAIGTAMASLIPLTDSSSLGTNPDPNANGNPGDPGEAVPTPVALPTLTLFIPEGFSPNGDGVHDTFFIENMSGMKASMEIFNRWGEVVFKANDYKNDWDGKCNIGLHFGNELPDGTYYYVIELSDGTKVARYITLYR
ncbi:MAG: gliding motility-associated C-terminal domain-containing protein, partial [Cytophagaceae bacterium]